MLSKSASTGPASRAQATTVPASTDVTTSGHEPAHVREVREHLLRQPRHFPGGGVPLGPAVSVTGVVLEQARARSLNAAGGSSPTL